MYFGTPCYSYALKCPFVYMVIQGTPPLFERKQKFVILFTVHATSKNEIHICSNKHETGLVLKRNMSSLCFSIWKKLMIPHGDTTF